MTNKYFKFAMDLLISDIVLFLINLMRASLSRLSPENIFLLKIMLQIVHSILIDKMFYLLIITG